MASLSTNAPDLYCGQTVMVQRLNHIRAGIIEELRKTKAVIRWHVLDHPTAKPVSTVPLSCIITK